MNATVEDLKQLIADLEQKARNHEYELTAGSMTAARLKAEQELAEARKRLYKALESAR